LRHLTSYHPLEGLCDQTFHLFAADGAVRLGPPSDTDEAERIEWVPLDDVLSLIQSGKMPNGLSLTAVLYALAFGVLKS
jgi:8-oxo-dGTP pyrophosphatase MutT (NUDIX family)